MMPNIDQQPNARDQKRIQQIVTAFFMQQTHNNVEKTDQLLGHLARAIQSPGVKLVHIGENVYIINVQGQNKVEFDNLSRAKVGANIQKLIPMMANMGIKTAVISTKEALKPKLDRLGVNYMTTEGNNNETVYTLELQ
mgnify:CR=1 FL=1